MTRIQTSVSESLLSPPASAGSPSLLRSASALVTHPALRPLLLSAGFAAARAIGFRLLGRPNRARPAMESGSGVLGVILRGALSGALHSLPRLAAQRVARSALHRPPGSGTGALSGLRLAEDASRGEAF